MYNVTMESIIQVELSFVSNWEGAERRSKKKSRVGGKPEEEGKRSLTGQDEVPRKCFCIYIWRPLYLGMKNADQSPSIIL